MTWDADSLHEHFTKLREADLRAIEFGVHGFEKLREADLEAIEHARESIDHRLGAMNEFRSAMGDIAARSMPREVAETRLSTLERFQARIVGGIAILAVIGVANLVKTFVG